MSGFRTQQRVLAALLILGLGFVSISVCNYHALTGSSTELSLLLYSVGLMLGFSAILSIILLSSHERRTTSVPPTRTSLVLFGVLAVAVIAGIAGFAYYLTAYIPEKAGFSIYAFSIGFLLGSVAVLFVYYLPNYLPQEEKQQI